MSRQKAFEQIYDQKKWTSTQKESLSGGGSMISYTEELRKQLPVIFKEYNIKTIFDAACGDFNWMKEVDLTGIKYCGVDVVPSVIETNQQYVTDNISFMQGDIVEMEYPEADLVIARDVMFHLPNEDALKIINNFKKSKSKYLLTTSHLGLVTGSPKVGGFHKLNLFMAPFHMPEPLLRFDDWIRPYSPREMVLFRREQLL